MIDDEVRRELIKITTSRSTACGEVALAVSPATTTTVTRRGVSSNSTVLLQALSSLALNGDITRVVPSKDQFIITHAASANARTYRYAFITGAKSAFE